MSIENNMKSIAESLKSMDETVKGIFDLLQARQSVQTQPIQPAQQPAQPAQPAQQSTLPTLAPEELETLRGECILAVETFGEAGKNRIVEILADHNLKQIADIGSDRAIYNNVLTEIRQSFHNQ